VGLRDNAPPRHTNKPARGSEDQAADRLSTPSLGLRDSSLHGIYIASHHQSGLDAERTGRARLLPPSRPTAVLDSGAGCQDARTPPPDYRREAQDAGAQALRARPWGTIQKYFSKKKTQMLKV
jgi:hypothetical protein